MMKANRAYCAHCRAERELNDPQEVKMPIAGKSRSGTKGVCSVCGHPLLRAST